MSDNNNDDSDFDFNDDEFSDSSSSTSSSVDSDHEMEENINIEEAEQDSDNDDDDDNEKDDDDDDDDDNNSKKESDSESDKEENDDDVSFFDENSGTSSDSDSDEEDNEDNQGDEDKKESKLSKTTKNVISLSLSANSFLDSSDDDSDDDDNYMRKFNKELSRKYVEEMHPESVIHNYEEVIMLCNIVRNKDNIIIDDLHRTLPFLTKFERARVLGQRAKQIENGAKPFVQVPENIVDAYVIAEMELKQKRIPFIIRRPIPGGKCEYWHLKDLEQVCF
jgi:DNA-directed RNA polymerase subunit K/omega